MTTDPHQTPNLDQVEVSELTIDIADTVKHLFSAGTVSETLEMLVKLAVDTIDGCDFAGIFLIEEGVVHTPACTDPFVQEIDNLQHSTEQGPCLDAINNRITNYSVDLADEDRWPQFASAATALGIRCVLALPLFSNGTKGALNLYTRYPAAFGVVDRANASILSILASQALSSARSHEVEEQLTDNLFAALSSREIIGQAQGILMERERITADAAFEVLRRASQHLNVKLREVAQTLIETGESPDSGSGRTS